KTNGPPVQLGGPFVLTVKETARFLAGAPQRNQPPQPQVGAQAGAQQVVWQQGLQQRLWQQRWWQQCLWQRLWQHLGAQQVGAAQQLGAAAAQLGASAGAAQVGA